MMTHSTEEENQKEEEGITVNCKNVDRIVKLMEIHSSYIQNLSSSILWIRNIYLIIIVAIISKIYLNQLDLNLNNNIDPIHGILTVFVISLFCYVIEGSSQFWQAQHLNRMSKLDKGLRKYLFIDQKDIIRDMYTYREIVDKITDKEESHIRFLCPKYIKFAFIFYISVCASAIVSIIFIIIQIDC